MSRAVKRLLRPQGYELAKASRLAWPLSRNAYSQHGEDLVLQELFPDVKGTYLDIGSGNPVHLSNTYGLYRRGWSGVSVDPLWANGILTKIIRPRDRFFRALVSNTYSQVDFYELDPSVCSTTDRSVAERVIRDGAVLQRHSKLNAVPARDLPFVTRPTEPSVLSIDVEGHELEVLESLNWELQTPQVIVIEMWNRDGRADINKSVSDLLRSNAFTPIATCGPDTVIFRHTSA